MNLPVVPARLLLEEEFAEPFGAEISGDAESICTMRFGNAVRRSVRAWCGSRRCFAPLASGCDAFRRSKTSQRIIPMKALRTE